MICLLAETTPFILRQPLLEPPPGFAAYFETNPEIIFTNHTNLLPKIKETKIGPFIKRLDLYNLPAQENMDLYLVLMEDINNKRGLLTIAQEASVPFQTHPQYGNFNVIGGTGIYPCPKGEIPVDFALKHTLTLASAMAYKTAIAGLREAYGLGGMKATITMAPGKTSRHLSDWEESPPLQKATGWLFGQAFPNVLTGTDARQTPSTISAMAEGNALAYNGENLQICGTNKNFDTPSACRYSLEAAHEFLQRDYPQLPRFEGNTVIIQGFGNIGQTAARLALDKGANVVIADPKLGFDQELKQKWQDLKLNYPGKIRVVPPETVYDQEGKIFMPCASKEGMLDKKNLARLRKAGVTLVLAGGNNILPQQDHWQTAEYASRLGIIIPPEELTNCGSVTMAGLEPVFRYLQTTEPYKKLTPEQAESKFVSQIVIPFIRENMEKRIDELLNIAQSRRIDLYRAGWFWYRQYQEKLTGRGVNQLTV